MVMVSVSLQTSRQDGEGGVIYPPPRGLFISTTRCFWALMANTGLAMKNILWTFIYVLISSSNNRETFLFIFLNTPPPISRQPSDCSAHKLILLTYVGMLVIIMLRELCMIGDHSPLCSAFATDPPRCVVMTNKIGNPECMMRPNIVANRAFQQIIWGISCQIFNGLKPLHGCPLCCL